MKNNSKKTRAELTFELEEAQKTIARLKALSGYRKEVEKELEEREETFMNFFKSSPMGIHMYYLDPDYNLIFRAANPAADVILGVNNNQFIGKTIEEAFPPLAETEIPERYRRAAAKGESWQTEQIDYKDGNIDGAFEVYAFRTKPNTMVVLFLDITERKKIEQALRLTQFSIDHMSDAAFWINSSGSLVYVNNAACRSLGYDREELMKLTVSDIDPNFPLEKWTQHWLDSKGSPSRTLETIHKKKDGTIFPVEVNVNNFMFSGLEYHCAFAHDITERKLAERELKDSEEKYRQLIEFSGDAIYLLYDRKFELINKRFREMFDVTLDDVNQSDFDFMQLVAPASKSYIEARNKRFELGEQLSPNYSFTALAVGNKEIEVEASVTYVQYKEGMATQGILRDVTERKHFENKLRQSQKMEAVGTLAGGIAHDFNNILMGIQGRTSLMLMQPDNPIKTKKHLKSVEDYIKSATDLTRQLLGFARGGKYEVKPIELNRLIGKNASMFGRTRKEIKIKQDFQEDLWVVEADAGQIEQVLLNLFVNAWQAMPDGGDLYLKTENTPLNEEDVKAYGVSPGYYVKIIVTDTGTGMDAAVQARIFDPFFTTKQIGRGTGLGLATVYGIVKNHSGFINVYSEVDKGTTFSIYLPASDKVPMDEIRVIQTIRKGKGTILLIDDEDMIIEVSLPLLESLGYNVFVARGGREGLEVYKEKSKNIDMVILDVVMPGLSGGETFDLLKEFDPQVKVLLSSGYSLHGQANEILKRGCKGFIQKPFDTYQISTKLSEILEKK